MRAGWLAPAAFLSAGAALTVEIAVVRLGAPFVGQSLLPWSAAIASVLLGLAIGHLLGGLAGGPRAAALVLRHRLSAAWTGAGLAALAMPLLAAPVAEALIGTEEYGWAPVLGLAALAFPPALAAGFVLPLALRLRLLAGGAVTRGVAAILAGSAAGSVGGTLAAGFLLLEVLGATRTLQVVGVLWLTLAAAVLPWGATRAARVAVMLGAVLLLAVAPAGPCDAETRYTCMRLWDRALPDGGMMRLMVLDEGLHSVSDRDDPQRLHLSYAAVADALARPVLGAAPAPRALVLGGGGATLPRAWAAADPPAEVVVAELDGRVAAAAASAMWADGPRLSTLVGDARAALRALPAEARFDVVLMDAYRTRSVPAHLVTREFAAMVAARMAPGGVYLSNVIDRAETMQLAIAVAATLATAFPAVEIWVPEEAGAGSTNVVLAAWRDPPAARPEVLRVEATLWAAGGAAERQAVDWRRLDLTAALARWPGACPVLLTDDRTPVDRLLAGRFACRR